MGIADGMGGKSGGEIASQAAIAAVSALLEKNPAASIPQLIAEAKQAVASKSLEFEEHADMATTLSLALIRNGQAEIGHVGDCRIYHLRGNGLVSRTKDQTEVQRLIDDGILSKQRARDYHRRNILLSVINATGAFELQENAFETEPGDRLILLTDGAYSLIRKDEIRDISLRSESLDELLAEMQRVIESGKVRDDYSAVACQVN